MVCQSEHDWTVDDYHTEVVAVAPRQNSLANFRINDVQRSTYEYHLHKRYA